MAAFAERVARAYALLRRAALPWRLGGCGRGARIDESARVFHPARVCLGRSALVGPDAFLIGNTLRPVGVRLGANVRVGRGSYLAATGGWIHLEDGAELGANVVAYGNGGLTVGAGAVLADEVAISTINHLSGRTDRPIRAQGLELAPIEIGPGAVLGRGAIVLPGVTVGAHARVAAGSVVTRDVPDGASVAGVPARPVVTPAPAPQANAANSFAAATLQLRAVS
jgi:acetyltransferase-like isoleucine patch superfamily enzyme